MSNMHTLGFLKGIFPVVPTPLQADESLDLAGLGHCLNFYMASDIQGITVLGSGGELPYFSDVEQLRVVKHVKHIVQDKKPIIMGINAFSVEQAITKIEQYQGLADAVMLLFHGYYKQAFSDLKRAVAAVSARSSVPVLYYHFPQVTGHYLSAKQIIEILNDTGVVGMKDSALQLKTAKTVLQGANPSAYFTGLSLLLPEISPYLADDVNADLPTALTSEPRVSASTKKDDLKTHTIGAICPLGAIAPILTSQLYKDVHNGETENAYALCTQLSNLLPIVNNLYLSPNRQYRLLRFAMRLPFNVLKQAASPQAASKEALRLLGVDISSRVRRPLPALESSASQLIKEYLTRGKLIKAK